MMKSFIQIVPSRRLLSEQGDLPFGRSLAESACLLNNQGLYTIFRLALAQITCGAIPPLFAFDHFDVDTYA